MKKGFYLLIYIFFLLSSVEIELKKTAKKKKMKNPSKSLLKEEVMNVPPIGMKNLGKSILARKKKNKKSNHMIN
jgi:hypothetical protein